LLRPKHPPRSIWPEWQTEAVDVVTVVLIVASVVSTAVLVLGMFIWGAVKDGQKDKATQARLGIRRRTRLGR
jgi:hypothetical protein